MTNNNRNEENGSNDHQDGNQKEKRFQDNRHNPNNSWGGQQINNDYSNQLKGGYGGSEYGNTYYRAEGIPNNQQNRMHEQPSDVENRYSQQQADRNRTGYGSGYNPGGYAQVGNTGGNFSDNGGYDNRQNSRRESGENYGAVPHRESWPEDHKWRDKPGDNMLSSTIGNGGAEHSRDDYRQQGGEHKGKGPRGYQRSAERIREDICDRLSDDPYIDASEIDVKIENNEVILSGNVESKEAKRRAEDLVESISGVGHVENRIRIQRREENNRGIRGTGSDRSRGHEYTGTTDSTGGIGDESGTTNEIIRNTGNMNQPDR